MAGSYGTYGKFGIGTASPVTQRLQYADETCILDEEIVDGNGIRGTRSLSIEVVRGGVLRVGGPANFIPTALEWTYLLPWILGGAAPSGTGLLVYPMAEAVATRYVTIDRVTKVFTYDGVAVSRASWQCGQSQLLTCGLELIGLTETVGNAGTFPALNCDVSTNPFIWSDCVISVGGTSVSAKEASWSIDNVIDADRFFNSRNLSAANGQNRVIRFDTMLPYGDYSALYGTGAAGAGAAVILTFTNGTQILKFTFPKVAIPKRSPNTGGKTEIMMPLGGQCYRSGTPGGVGPTDLDEIKVELQTAP